ncbi:MAG TPA: peptide ABC transporter substrate-binding protein [Candidatus Eisenbacteria bacterium]|nr:peptide ABC transporter substrate-binding protein [Candidatus Eisenbacteria bacterium]
MSKLSERISSFFGRKTGTAGPADAHQSFDKRLVLHLAGKRAPTLKQLKHLPRYLSVKEKVFLRTVLALAVVAVIAIGAKFASEHVSAVAAPGGDYVEASVGAPHYVNPILSSTNDADLDLVKLVFAGLMKTTSRGEMVPDLAASYQISEDGKTYTFVLKDGVTWQDGAAFTSHDVAATIEYIKNPAWKSPLAAQFKNVTVAAPDDKTVVFTLAEPFAPFLSMLTVGILPEHLWQEVKPENAGRAELNIKPVGTGPFKFKNFAKDKKGAILSYTLARNDAYHGTRPYLASITFKYYQDFTSAQEALVSRRVDGMSFLPLEFREAAEKQRNVRFYTLRLPQYTGVFFNQKKNAALRSKEVRQALAYGIDRSTVLREALGDNGVLVSSPILAGFVGFHPDAKKYGFDPATAADLLEKEGWKIDPADGIRKKEERNDKKEVVKTPLEITLTTVDAKENMAVAQTIKKDWEGLGVKTELEIEPSSKIQKDKIRPRDYDALLYGEIIGTDPDPFPFWHSSQNDAAGLNLAVFSNRRADELLEKARTATKTEDRETLYREFQDILAEEVPAILLYSPTYTYVVGRKVKGIETATIFTPADRFDDVSNWYIETRRVWK